jgi:hypothetical protein
MIRLMKRVLAFCHDSTLAVMLDIESREMPWTYCNLVDELRHHNKSLSTLIIIDSLREIIL